MKTFSFIQVTDLRFQIDYVTPKKSRPFEEYETAHERNILYVLLIKHKEIKMVSDGYELTGIEPIQMTMLYLEDFLEKYNLKNDTKNKSGIQIASNYPLYPLIKDS